MTLKNTLNGSYGFIITLLFIITLVPASAGLLSFIDSVKISDLATGNAVAVNGAFCGDGICQAPYEGGMNCAVDCPAKKNLFGYAAQAPPKTDKAKKASCVTNGQLDAPPEMDVDCGASCKIKCGVAKKCAKKTDCASGVCTNGACQPAKTCTDKKLTKGESSIDCGGIKCNACDLDKKCLLNSDCKSGRCDYYCVSCSDGIRNGDETDKDCGGTCPNKCDDYTYCSSDLDCKSKVCDPFGVGYQCKTPSCFDRAWNGDETDLNCGGSCKTTVYGAPVPIRCEVGQGCKIPVDCKSNSCVSGKCVAPTCQDGQLNQNETDVDCGGVSCGSTCGQSKNCNVNSDCQSGNCENYQGKKQCLSTPTCTDGRLNQGESDIDCGGPCQACDLTKKCNANIDCQSGKCDMIHSPRVCVSCSDGIKNGDETDKDCGGTCPNKCNAGQGCNNGGDCGSAVCFSGHCQAPTCTDMHKNGDETDVDCGGSCTTKKCVDLRMCKSNSDCQSGNCDLSTSKCASCSDGVQDGDETNIDCGGSCPAKCSIGIDCMTAADCASNNCIDGYCVQATTCNNGAKDNAETDVDCGGTDKNGCNACVAGKTCAINSDCADNVCSSNGPNGNICQSATYKAPVGALGQPPHCRGVAGWACDPDDYTKALTINFYTGTASSPGSLLQTLTASDASNDASVQCGGKPAHGFSVYQLPYSGYDTLWVYAVNIGAGGPGKLLGTRERTCA